MSQQADPILDVTDVSVEFRTPNGTVRPVEGVTLDIAPGEVLGIVGESGSGKSVLVRSLLLLLPEGGRVVEGNVRYRGQDLLAMPKAELRKLRGREIAHVLPDAKAQLNPLLSVGELMSTIIHVHEKVGRKETRQRAADALRLVSVPDPERRLAAYPHELSGGMAQRVCIALALLHNPRLVIADEPTAGLDVTVQRQVLDLMTSLTTERGAAQLIVTRDLGIVAQYCHRVAVMQNGRIVETGVTMDFFDSPTHPYSRKLLESAQLKSRKTAKRG